MWADDPLLLERVLSLPEVRQRLASALEPSKQDIYVRERSELKKGVLSISRPVPSSGNVQSIAKWLGEDVDTNSIVELAKGQWENLKAVAGLGVARFTPSRPVIHEDKTVPITFRP